MVLLRAHEHIFAVIFWFIVLGMTGALLYALLLRMHEKNIDVHGAFASSVRDLHDIMMWPSARLLALGFALGGSLVDALDGWRSVSGHTLDCSEDIIYMSGLGAIQYQPEQTTEDDSFREDFASLMQGLQAMINRTLVVWLTVLGCLTIGGWLS
jgi:membrane protein required for beta-lactamase induction